MRTFALGFVVVLAGCGNKPHRLVGTWRSEDGGTFEYAANGTFVETHPLFDSGLVIRGAWSIVRESETDLVVRTSDVRVQAGAADPIPAPQTELTITFDTADHVIVRRVNRDDEEVRFALDRVDSNSREP